MTPTRYKKIVGSYDEADEIARGDTDAGYVNWHFDLTDDDFEALKNGKHILFTGIEYGIVLSYKAQIEEKRE